MERFTLTDNSEVQSLMAQICKSYADLDFEFKENELVYGIFRIL